MKKLALLGLVGAAVAGAVVYKKIKEARENSDTVIPGSDRSNIPVSDPKEDEEYFELDDIDSFHDAPVKEEKRYSVPVNGEAKYESFNTNKELLIENARNTLETAKTMVKPAKAMLNDLGHIINDKAEDAGIYASDYIGDAKEKVENIIGGRKEKFSGMDIDNIYINEEQENTDL